MEDTERFERGVEKYNEVYCGDLPAMPRGTMPFFDDMMQHLFGEIWTRPGLSQRDRRLVTMGVIAALGEGSTFAIQARSALKNGELTAEQLREMLIHLSQYAGYPRVAGLLMPVEEVIAEFEKAAEK